MEDELEHITEETIKYAPLAAQSVVAVEAAAKGMPGQSKREIALQTVLVGARVAQGMPVKSVASVGLLLDLLVTVFNATGIFTKKPAARPE